MRPELRAILDQISVMGQELAPDSIDRLARDIDRCAAASDVDELPAPTARERALLARLADLCEGMPTIEPSALSLALRSASRTSEEVTARQSIDLVWTGPRTDDVPLRRNDQALQEVIASAEREVLLVSFAVYSVPKIADALTKAMERGARVSLVLEFSGSTEGDQSYDPYAALGELPDDVAVYEWPFASRPEIGHTGKRGYIHVKCAVADRSLAFVSSANLTAYAMEANMELGVLVHGGTVPGRIATQFDRLIQQGTLQPYIGHG